MLFELIESDLDGAFELHVMTGDHVFWPILDIHVGRRALVLDGPFVLAGKESAAWRDRAAAIDKRRRVRRITWRL